MVSEIDPAIADEFARNRAAFESSSAGVSQTLAADQQRIAEQAKKDRAELAQQRIKWIADTKKMADKATAQQARTENRPAANQWDTGREKETGVMSFTNDDHEDHGDHRTPPPAPPRGPQPPAWQQPAPAPNQWQPPAQPAANQPWQSSAPAAPAPAPSPRPTRPRRAAARDEEEEDYSQQTWMQDR